ncbi:Hypothetical predicted protein, partial [Scomber scombrus]
SDEENSESLNIIFTVLQNNEPQLSPHDFGKMDESQRLPRDTFIDRQIQYYVYPKKGKLQSAPPASSVSKQALRLLRAFHPLNKIIMSTCELMTDR